MGTDRIALFVSGAVAGWCVQRRAARRRGERTLVRECEAFLAHPANR